MSQKKHVIQFVSHTDGNRSETMTFTVPELKECLKAIAGGQIEGSDPEDFVLVVGTFELAEDEITTPELIIGQQPLTAIRTLTEIMLPEEHQNHGG